ncbi:hypothetical protein HOE67_00950 [Candidatus Peregrinibacteria bacterium]|jgi:tRNA G10  N-methylase Trm11|nr:hypothetical protein [Candidatus Peregrinibacteria bacterium]MBT4055655.1 hypothetical protein [Candidatus Peregrinibacteria bacterium]
MNTYAFELGRIKELAVAELKSLFGDDSVEEIIDNYAIVRTDHTATQKTQDRLGGIIKIIEITEEDTNPPKNPQELETKFKEHIQSILSGYIRTKDTSGKTLFAINAINLPGSSKIFLKNSLIFSKKFLKSSTISSRFINKPWTNTTSAQVYKSKILEKGVEITVLFSPKTNKIFAGKTISIQNLDNYSLRDYKKPKRDAHLGMLPPKLAQIMINLAEPNILEPNKTIYDPFCGTGTVLTESLLMNKDANGSDLQERMTEYSDENCKWLTKEFHTHNKFHTFTKDAILLTKEDVPQNIDAVITEGYLGKPQSTIVPKEQRDKIFGELGELHKGWLTNIHPLLTPGTPIIMCLTAFNIGHDIEHFPEFEQLAKKAGFKILQTFTYSRKDQMIVRDIIVMVS